MDLSFWEGFTFGFALSAGWLFAKMAWIFIVSQVTQWVERRREEWYA